jgi:hypothetical protein
LHPLKPGTIRGGEQLGSDALGVTKEHANDSDGESNDYNIYETFGHCESLAMRYCFDEECARVEEQLIICAACRDRITELDGFITALRLAIGQ